MIPEIEDALYTACGVTTRFQRQRMERPNHPRAIGTFPIYHSSVIEFKTKLLAFLRELNEDITVAQLREELE